MIFLMVNVATCKVNMTYIDPKGNWIVMKFVPLQEFFPGTLRRPTLFFFYGGIGIGHSFGGCKVVQANGSSIPCIQRFHNQGRFWSQLHNTDLRNARKYIIIHNCPRTVRYSHRTHTDGVSGEMKGHRDGDRTTSLSGFV